MVETNLTSDAGHHDPDFSKGIEFHFNSNTFKNAESHLRDAHFLDEGGDVWRMRAEALPQASGIINGAYERVIPFRQKEFKNAFLEWVILDDIKHRKAASTRLKRLFRIANNQAADNLPEDTTTAKWIHEMFEHFEPQVIHEVQNAKSRILVSFDGWGLKHEKISVVSVIIYFINDKYENVTRLIGLLELPGHRKAGVNKWSFLLIY